MQHHIDELAALGDVAASLVALLSYRGGHETLSIAPMIDVLASQTSGELQPVLLRMQSNPLVGAESDPTDRESEV